MEMSAAPTSRPLTEESDWDLVVAVKNGEDRAFEILVNRYKARILSLAFRITRNHEDAQDVTQQSFQNAFVHLQKFQGKSSFPTWLTRIAINEALMCLRKNRVSRAVSLEEVNLEYASVLSTEHSDARANPEELYIQREKEQILSFVIDRLPPLLQRAVRLYLDDLTIEEVGHCLGVRIPTVKARLFRGLKKASALFKHYVHSAQRGDSTNLDTVCDGERLMS
jgi:RNA polymerase sigma-70 factor (ECF subfamily)